MATDGRTEDVRTGTATANGIELTYDAFGDPADPPVVLVMGLGTQRLAWADELCDDLAGAGRHVVRYDNRDVGESTHLAALGRPRVLDVLRRRPPYGIEDMADDLAGLLDALGLDDAHLVGASMGGFIAQSAAIRHPGRVRTLTLIMTSTGSLRVGRPSVRALWPLLGRSPATDRAEAIDQAVEAFRVIGSPGFPVDEDRLRRVAAESWDRSHDTEGYRRQLAAVVGQRDRTDDLERLDVPTLVVHGLADPLVHPSGGMAVARAVPGASFLGFSGMGHDLPRQLWPTIVGGIVEHTGGRGVDAA